jgi:hypothetical protein
VTIRDSGGIHIVESEAPQWDVGAAWMVDEQPTLDIGLANGDPDFQFDRIAGVLRLRNGRIVVADGGSSEIRFFDQRGRFLRRTGRPGAGPGEFTMIMAMGLAGPDSIWVYDFSLRRITYLSFNGDVLGVAAIQPGLPTLGVVGRLKDGSFVFAQLWSSGRIAEADRSGLRRDDVVYARYAPSGTLLDTIGVHPGREVFLMPIGGRMTMGTPPFGRTSSHTTGSETIFIGSQTTFEIGEYTAAGSPRKLIRLPDMDLDVELEDVEAVKRQQIDNAPSNERRGMREYLDAMGAPATRPAYLHFLVDSERNLWASAYATFPRKPVDWYVFDGQGRWLGTVLMPRRFRPYAIGESWLVGVSSNDLDIEYVRLYSLQK